MSALSKVLDARQRYISWAKYYHKSILRYQPVAGMEIAVSADRTLRAMALGAARELDYIAKTMIDEAVKS